MLTMGLRMQPEMSGRQNQIPPPQRRMDQPQGRGILGKEELSQEEQNYWVGV